MENLMTIGRFTGVMQFDYRQDFWFEIRFLAERILTAPLCLLGKHKYRGYNPKVDVCHRCNRYKFNKKRRVN